MSATTGAFLMSLAVLIFALTLPSDVTSFFTFFPQRPDGKQPTYDCWKKLCLSGPYQCFTLGGGLAKATEDHLQPRGIEECKVLEECQQLEHFQNVSKKCQQKCEEKAILGCLQAPCWNFTDVDAVVHCIQNKTYHDECKDKDFSEECRDVLGQCQADEEEYCQEQNDCDGDQPDWKKEECKKECKKDKCAHVRPQLIKDVNNDS